jgi:N-acetylmuramoyl-L-alanine amidase
MRIVLDPGHGGSDSGATHKGIREADIALNLCIFVRGLYLSTCPNDEIILTRNGDTERSLKERALFANDRNADVFLSVHLNADPDHDGQGMPEAHGGEIWIHPQASQKTKRIAERFSERFGNYSNNFRGIKEANFAVLKRTKMPAILIEVGFMDNDADLQSFIHPRSFYQTTLKLVNAINHALV